MALTQVLSPQCTQLSEKKVEKDRPSSGFCTDGGESKPEFSQKSASLLSGIGDIVLSHGELVLRLGD